MTWQSDIDTARDSLREGFCEGDQVGPVAARGCPASLHNSIPSLGVGRSRTSGYPLRPVGAAVGAER